MLPCRIFLERLAAHAADHGPVGSTTGGSTSTNINSSSNGSNTGQHWQQLQDGVKQYQDIPVYVAPPCQQQQHQQPQQQRAVHDVMGYITVPMNASAQEVYDTINVCCYMSETEEWAGPLPHFGSHEAFSKGLAVKRAGTKSFYQPTWGGKVFWGYLQKLHSTIVAYTQYVGAALMHK